MLKNKIWLCLYISIFFILFTGVAAKAEWIDDWFQQKVYTGPNHYKSSTRGYGTFGSASLRWNNSRDYLIGISPPQFKSGCGGIDLFFGGYQFMDIDHLVSKLTAFANPGVMAALATDIAMSVLSEQVADSAKSLMAIVDRLNQLQFDDCQAQKTVSAVIKAGFDPESFSEKASQAVSRYALLAGLSDLYDEIKNFGNGRTPGAALGSAGGTVMQMVSGCPEDLRNIYFSQGYVLDHLVTKLGAPYRSDYVALMRGLVGDIFIDTSAGNVNYRVEKPCAQNPGVADITLSHFVDGNIQKMNSTGQCVMMNNLNIGSSSYRNLRDYIFQSLVSIVNNIINKAPLSLDEQTFLSEIPAPVYSALIAYVGLQGADADASDIAMQFTDYIAAYQVYYMMNDWSAHMSKAINLAQKVYDDQAGTSGGGGQNTCHFELGSNCKDSIEKLLKDLRVLIRRIGQDYQTSQNALVQNLQINDYFRAMSKELKQASSNKVSGNTQKSTPIAGH